MMSQASSMPMDRRTDSGDKHVCSCSSGESGECVVVDGGMINDLASSMFAKSLNILTLLISLAPALPRQNSRMPRAIRCRCELLVVTKK